jgi:hypothetical protein
MLWIESATSSVLGELTTAPVICNLVTYSKMVGSTNALHNRVGKKSSEFFK